MSILRLVAIALVFAVACAGWAVLGTTTLVRSGGFSDRLQDEVEKLWGGELVQEAPQIALGSFGEARAALLPVSNHVQVRLACDHRRKGLIWYPTYTCDFAATYVIANPGDRAAQAHVHLGFPAAEATYDAFVLTLDGQAVAGAAVDTAKGVDLVVELEPGQRRSLLSATAAAAWGRGVTGLAASTAACATCAWWSTPTSLPSTTRRARSRRPRRPSPSPAACAWRGPPAT